MTNCARKNHLVLFIRGRSFWDIRVPNVCSYAWRKLLNLRELICPLLYRQIGDGFDTLFWHDNWRPKCPLKTFFTSNYGIPYCATVAEVSRGIRWHGRLFIE